MELEEKHTITIQIGKAFRKHTLAINLFKALLVYSELGYLKESKSELKRLLKQKGIKFYLNKE